MKKAMGLVMVFIAPIIFLGIGIYVTSLGAVNIVDAMRYSVAPGLIISFYAITALMLYALSGVDIF